MIKLLTTVLSASVILFLSISDKLYAQESPDRHVFTITKYKWKKNIDAKSTMLDSLNKLEYENVINKNKYIISRREMSHMMTEDSQDYLVLTEFKSIEDWDKSSEENTKLRKKWLKTDEKIKEFYDNYRLFFERWHGDYMYSEMPNTGK